MLGATLGARDPGARPLQRKLSCAVYTRKSSEEGLDMDFNSLDAQRESCEAYIASQRAEGWAPVADRYDDGGFSGGTLERPALRRLLADVTAGRIDVIVVYKIDRLSRSMLDFLKLVELFEGHGVTFVSVTQSFNTKDAMGRMQHRGVRTMTLGSLWGHLRATPISTSKRLSRPPRNLRVGRQLKIASFIPSIVMQQALQTKRGISFCSAPSSRIFIPIILRDLDRRVRSQQLSQHLLKRHRQRKTSTCRGKGSRNRSLNPAIERESTSIELIQLGGNQELPRSAFI